MPNSKSGRGSFRHFYFSYFTFHFYMYKVLRGIGEVGVMVIMFMFMMSSSVFKDNDHVLYVSFSLYKHLLVSLNKFNS